MYDHVCTYMAVCQNLVPLVNIKIAGKWMFIPLKMVLIGIDPYPYQPTYLRILLKKFLRQCSETIGHSLLASAWSRLSGSDPKGTHDCWSVLVSTTLWLCQNSYWTCWFIVDFIHWTWWFSIVMLVYQRVSKFASRQIALWNILDKSWYPWSIGRS